MEPRQTAADVVGGLLAVASIVLSAIAAGLGLLLDVEARPLKVAPVAIVLALVAGRMTSRYERLALAAVVAAMAGWLVGMTLAVVTENPLL
jgi:predicted branched-subunit amino acid permease